MMQLSIFDPPAMPCNLAPLIFDFDLEKPYQAPAPLPVVPANRIVFAPGTAKRDEIVKRWSNLPLDVQKDRMVLTFSESVTMQYNSRKRESKLVHVFRLFTDIASGRLCNSLTGCSGWIMADHVLSRLISIEPEPKKDLLSMVKKLANRIHQNAWYDLKEKLLAKPEEYLNNYGYTVTNISGKFPDYVMQSIHKAFEEKSDYSYDAGGYSWGHEKKTGRDLKVECKLCDDGIFRAWFSSEYPGCCNGDYWLLLNPTTAAFKEKD